MKKIKRIAGSSVGAITATLVAVGFTSQDLKEFMDQDLRKVFVGTLQVSQLYWRCLSRLEKLRLYLLCYFMIFLQLAKFL